MALPSHHWVSGGQLPTTRLGVWAGSGSFHQHGTLSPEEGGHCPGAMGEEQASLGEQRAGREFLAGQWFRSGNNYEKDSDRPALLGIEVREADQRGS